MPLSDSLIQIVLPKKRMTPGGTSQTSTFSPSSSGQALAAPNYQNHLTDIFTSRTASNAQALMKDMVKYDTDVSATLHAYLTLCSTDITFMTYSQDGKMDTAGLELVQRAITLMSRRNDYSTGFRFVQSLNELGDSMRYMALLRGGTAVELVFDKLLNPTGVRHIDLANVSWTETKPGEYKPLQKAPSGGDDISLDVPNVFVKLYRQNPTEIYPESPFVSAINTIAARQQVINDLYRIMQKTGYPRLDVEVVEEVLRKNAPTEIQQNDAQLSNWVAAYMRSISAQLSGMRADTAFVHSDAIKTKIEGQGPGKSLDAQSIISVLNSQNQAALKTVATIIGRGEAGVNTASVEARVFSMSADALNRHVGDMMSEMLTFALRMAGYQGYVVVKYAPAELRPLTELEPQLTLRQQRLMTALSYGVISDDEFHMQMYNRPAPEGAPQLSGTNFMTAANESRADEVTPNDDPLGRSLSPEGSSAAKTNVKK